MQLHPGCVVTQKKGEQGERRMKDSRLTRIVSWIFPGWKLQRLRAEIARREAARERTEPVRNAERPLSEDERRVW